MENELNEICKIIGKNIKKARLKNITSSKKNSDYTLEKVANRLKVSKSCLSQLENGKLNSIKFEKILNLCKEINVKFFFILKETSLDPCNDENEFENLLNKNYGIKDLSIEYEKVIKNFVKELYNMSFPQNNDTEKDFKKNIGINIRNIRIQKNISQKELTEKMNLADTNAISRIERGKTKVTFDMLIRICMALEISFQFIFQNNKFDKYSIELQASDMYVLFNESQKSLVKSFVEAIPKIQKIYADCYNSKKRSTSSSKNSFVSRYNYEEDSYI